MTRKAALNAEALAGLGAQKLADLILAEAKPSLISSFARGIAGDRSAIRATITEPWSNGQVEGQITKLKLVKRQMYGRANLDLLQARLMPVA